HSAVATRTHAPPAFRRRGTDAPCASSLRHIPCCISRYDMTAEPDQYGVVGHPVSHSWSPFIHGLFARDTHQSLTYRLFDFTPEAFRERVREFFAGGGKGLNVTLPHKMAAAQLADELTPRAARAGAVNTLAVRGDGRLLGDNTDGPGLVH